MATKHYLGSYQCGVVSFEADVDLDQTITCNCSRCQRLGSVLAFTPRDKFVLKSGEDTLTEYRFNTKKLQHLFCATCGIESFAYGSSPSDGSPVVAVNVNCLESVDPRALTSHHFDGAAV